MFRRSCPTLVLLLLLILVNHRISAQEISGTVTDDMTGKPISGVSLSLKGTTTGTATNSIGFFRLTVPNLPAVLVVSHLSYRTREVLVSNESAVLNIVLEPASYPLSGIEVQPAAVTEVLSGKSFDVLDYEFIDGYILLLANRNGSMFRPCLVLVDMEGDTLDTYDISRPDRLYRDFEDKVHFISRQSVFLVNTEDDILNLSYVSESDEFLSTYPYIVDRRSADWILKNYQYKNQVLDYYHYSENDKKYNVFCSIANEPAIARSRWGNYFDGTEADLHFAQLIVNHPVFAPMFRHGDSLIVFNYYDKTIDFYDDLGNKQGSIDAIFVKQKGCKEEIYLDCVTGKFYVLFRENGISTLDRIDLKTGNAVSCASIPGFVFIEKIEIYNDEVFFLYREKAGQEKKKMYRMKI
jgi:hypothetical protein